MTLTTERLHEVLGKRADVIESLDEADRAARAVVDPALLALCEKRVAQLLGHRSDPIEVSALTDLEAACLAFTEQWVIDVASMTDEVVAPVAERLGDAGLMDFAHALLVVEQRLRLDLAWNRLGLGL